MNRFKLMTNLLQQPDLVDETSDDPQVIDIFNVNS